ncbi:glycosyltransferase [Paenibacillus mucilaginosus]|uniref:Glycosyl transferase family 2 n=1 Tax=Paenibacillus mucilaginosus (strain KNP414) TaxID=1036673 RepID=F8FQG5_PAEMK|nr:glycosyltransferase [Paenibacillus mucilaginosus]AEI39226.1 glycosyl transferase family 2 [Paenibacillus mucilaginosus KNP414]MCG7217132.1 glycosyltransferase [Paenibacillus mucilaginosus]WDM28235.1 glycosyltransferase [Paenibacillus mucilaginosus]
MNYPLVGVIIPCYNYGEYIEETLDSVLSSTYPNIEIIIVDDGSTDQNTLGVLEKIREQGLARVHVRANGGLSAARNTGISLTSGKYIVTLDADDLIAPTFIEKAVWLLEEESGAAFVYSLVQLFGRQNKIWETFEATLFYLKFRNVVPATIVIRRECWKQVGGYDESMREGYEDWEFVLRLTQAGYKGHHINEPLFFYRKHKGSMLEESKRKSRKLKHTIRRKHPEMYRLWPLQFLVFGFLEMKRRTLRFLKKSLVDIYHHIPTSIINAMKRFRKQGNRYKPIETCRENTGTLLNVKTAGDQHTIMFVLPWLHVGGVERVFLELIRSISNHFRVVLITTKSSSMANPWTALFEQHVCALYHLGDYLPDEEQRSRFILYLVQRWRVNIFHISNSQLGYRLLPVLKRQPSKPFTIDTLHMHEPWAAWDYFEYNRHFCEYLDHTVVLTSSQKEMLVESKGQNAAQISVIPNGIKLPQLLGRKETKIPFTVGFIGRVVMQKQPIVFLRTAKELRQRGCSSVQFTLVGEGDQLRTFLALRKLWGLEEVVEVRDFTDDVVQTMKDMHALFIPSLREGLPIVGIEAMSQGLPIIAPDVPGWNDLVLDGETGFLCTSSPKEFADKILVLAGDSTLYTKLSTNSIRRYKDHFQLQKMSGGYEKLYRDMLGSVGVDHLEV